MEKLDFFKFYGWPGSFDPKRHGTYDLDSHKVVPKDAVVLELDKSPLSWWGSVEDLRKYATDMQESYAAQQLIQHLADQIEKQQKPPRISEPGLWGVVEGRDGNRWIRTSDSGAFDWQPVGRLGRTATWDGVQVYAPLTAIREGV